MDEEKAVDIDVSSDEERPEPPRSHSLPIAKWVEQAYPETINDNDDDELDDSPKEGAWELAMKRDFNGEV